MHVSQMNGSYRIHLLSHILQLLFGSYYFVLKSKMVLLHCTVCAIDENGVLYCKSQAKRSCVHSRSYSLVNFTVCNAQLLHLVTTENKKLVV